MKIKQLGNGGGFDFNQTNSSFLISNDDETDYTLFDCGYNVMARLLDESDPIDIEKINNVIISHMDEDHIGNLKMLIYWRYFNFGKSTNIVCGFRVEEDLRRYLNKMDHELIGGLPSNTIMYHFNNRATYYNIKFIEGYHGVIPSYGVLFYNKCPYDGIFISGDTKANFNIEKKLKDFISLENIKYIFHDYSHWDNVTRNVHACKTDFNLEYSEEFRNKVIKYHTGDSFNSDWLM